MIAIDTNLLIYAHRSVTPEHRAAKAAIERGLNTAGGCGITLPGIAEFLSTVTHRTTNGRPSSPKVASEFLASLREAGVEVLAPGPSFGERLAQLAVDLGVSGVRVFDLQIGLCALDGGAAELWSHDRNFVRIPGLMTRDPLGSAG